MTSFEVVGGGVKGTGRIPTGLLTGNSVVGGQLLSTIKEIKG